MTDCLMLVFANPVAGQDDAFNEWYDSRHVADVLAVPGVVAGQRYDLAPMVVAEGTELPADLPQQPHRYLALYELNRDPNDVMKAFLDRVADGQIALSETLDLATVSMAFWTTRSERIVAD